MSTLATMLDWLLAQTGSGAASVAEMAHMTPASWVYMIVVWLAITILNGFCFYRLFVSKRGAPPPG